MPFVAFKIPNFLRRLFAEGAFSGICAGPLRISHPTIQRRNVGTYSCGGGQSGDGIVDYHHFGDHRLSGVGSCFCAGIRGRPVKMDHTIYMLRITFPYLLLISLTAFAGAILNSYDNFAVPALTPVLFNLSMIGAAFGLTSIVSEPVYALAWGF